MICNPFRSRLLVAGLIAGGLLISAPRHAWAQG
ncbi:MAG: hypothetical protein QOF89_1330 [Acidobacteriota bacterium]|jgi:hypothetical protein|nr:hypothetical protein [Acidobacteriota bacterium]